MKKLLICLCLLVFMLAGAEETCSVCGGRTAECTVDASGAIYCMGTLVHYPAEQTAECYTVRNGTRYIGAWAFAGNDALPDTLLVIGASAFCECVSLTEVTLPSHLYAIGESAYADQSNLTFVFDIPYCD